MIEAIIHKILIIAPDDAFYYLQLINGSTSITETNGYHPLLPLFLFPTSFFSNSYIVLSSTFLYYLILLATPFVVLHLYKTKWGFIIWLFPAMWVGNVMMELPLLVLIIFLGLRYTKLAGLIGLARLDYAPLVVLSVIRKRRMLWAIVPIFIWLIFNLVVFRTIFPDSVSNSTFSSTNYFSLINKQYPMLLWIPALIACMRVKPILVIQFFIVLASDYIRNAPFMWHYAIIPVIAVFGWRYIYSLTNHKLIPITVGVIGALFLYTYITFGYFTYPWQTLMYENQPKVPSTLGAYNSGIQGFFNSQKVYNLDGVFNHRVELTDYVVDFEGYVGEEYKLIEVFGFGVGINQEYGLWRKVK